jgi:hypothetical protein
VRILFHSAHAVSACWAQFGHNHFVAKCNGSFWENLHLRRVPSARTSSKLAKAGSVAAEAGNVHTPTMTLKNAALLALIGTIPATLLLVWTFVMTALNVLRDWPLRRCCSRGSSMRLLASAWRCSSTCSTGRNRDDGERAAGPKESSAYGSMPASD